MHFYFSSFSQEFYPFIFLTISLFPTIYPNFSLIRFDTSFPNQLSFPFICLLFLYILPVILYTVFITICRQQDQGGKLCFVYGAKYGKITVY